MAKAKVRASAPAKVILFGEHAVVYGEMAIAMAVTMETEVTITPAKGDHHTVNGRKMRTYQHLFMEKACEVVGTDQPLEFRTSSKIPSASGLGSSSALATASAAALLQWNKGRWTQEDVARAAYETEWLGQDQRGSPTDTSAATHGQAILVARKPRGELLWQISRDQSTWCIHHVPPPDMPIVVAFSREKGKTAREVAKVARLVERSPAGPVIIEELGHIAHMGADALRDGDHERVAELMNEAHIHLDMLGVSTSRLNQLVEVARDAGATGAKLTGAGGGGCIIAIGGRADKVRGALANAGARAWTVSPHPHGVRTSGAGPE